MHTALIRLISRTMLKTAVAAGTMLCSVRMQAQEQRSVLSRASDHYARLEYALAAPLYEKLADNKKADISVLEKLASCYRETNRYEQAANWYGKITARADAKAEDWLYYGDMLKSQGKYTEAKAAYEQYQLKSGTNAASRMAGCDSALAWISAPAPGYRVINRKDINTSLSEWAAVACPHNIIVFTSDSLRYTVLDPTSKVNPRYAGRTDHPYQKLYVVDTVQNHPGVSFIHGFAPALNQYDYHIGPIAFSAGFDTAWFTVTNPGKPDYKHEKVFNKKEFHTVYYGTRRLQLFMSTKNSKGQWQQPVPFAWNKAGAYSVGHAALSRDGRTIYFVSDMPGGLGKTDIWYCELQNDGNWGAPQNCGPAINTAEEEEFPTIGLDGDLYFSSKGLTGMGGFDIFKATGARASWQTPVNVKYPINSPADDFYYTVRDAAGGFFSSNRAGGAGDDDVYEFAVVLPAKPRTVLPALPATTQSSGDANTGNNTAAGNKAGTGATDTAVAATAAPQLIKNFVVYFDYDHSTLTSSAFATLAGVVTQLKEHGDYYISIEGHTDVHGSDQYDMVLSQKRARIVYDYLKSRGINAGRMELRYFGKRKLATTNSPAEDWRNRRTEINLYKK